MCVVWRFLISETHNSQTQTHTHKQTYIHHSLSGDTALMVVRLYCDNRELYALLVLNKAGGSEL